jgi:putative membrane protein
MIVLAGFIIGSLVKIWPWTNAEAIVLSQFPELAASGESLPAEIISQYMASADLHIGGAVLFALIGFCLVTGIEMAGKLVSRKKSA